MDDRFIVYGRSSCPYCVLAVELLEEREREVIFFDFLEQQDAIDEVKAFYAWPTVPAIIVNNKVSGETNFIGGYSDLLEREGIDAKNN